MKSIYYAHAIWLYGTEAERQEIRQIRKRFRRHRIVNPRNLKPPSADTDMKFYLESVASCDYLVFSRLRKKVTAGVGLEVKRALQLKKQVYELRATKWIGIHKPIKALSRKATLELFSKMNKSAHV